jgi:hypothetical protein
MPIFRHIPAAKLSLAPINGDDKKTMRQQMHRLVQQIKHLVSGQESAGAEMKLNRIAQGSSHDRALAAFKADQIRVARRARRVGVAPQSARV